MNPLPDDESEGSVDPTEDEGIRLPEPLAARLDGDQPADEPGAGRTAVAEWALWGKEGNDGGYRVLRCSKGAFHPGDFHEVITRYASGTQESLPQYTVCWIPDGNARERYVAVGIHELADPDPRRSGGRVRASRGREIEYIRLFCVRYSEMARSAASYAELVKSVLDYQLPTGLTDRVTLELLEIDSPPFPAPVISLAENVATLLLTTRPVCVLVPEEVGAEERLRFIDQVMSLLPYGLRSTMSAATSASATAKNLKLRLFFTNAQRDDGGATAHVTWGQPMRFDLSAPEGTLLRHYVSWLQRAGAGAATELVGQTDPVRFDPDEIRQMIANLPRERPVRDVLEELADGVLDARLPGVRMALRRLRQRRYRPLSRGEREEYRAEIQRLGLLKDHQGLPSAIQASVYRVLLALAFGRRLSYGGYCQIEDCVGGPPRGALGREMLKLEFSSFLPWLLTVKSASELTDQELLELLHQQGIAAAEPLTEFCRGTSLVRPVHRPAGYDFAVRYLRAYAEDAREELARGGYLAETLEVVFPHDQRTQCSRLKETLAFVYGGMLSEEVSAELLSRPDVRRTLALEAAVAELTVPPVSGNSRHTGEVRTPPQAPGEPGRKTAVSASTATCLLVLGAVVIGVALALIALLF